MICSTPKEMLVEIKRYMDLNDIPIKDLAVRMDTSPQNVSKKFKNENPTLKSIYEICNALNVKIDFSVKDTNK